MQVGWCGTCKQEKPLAELQVRWHTKDKTYYRCRSCSTSNHRKVMQTDRGKASAIRAQRKYFAANPERRKAHNAVKDVAHGPCIVCGGLPTHRHHPDVSKPTEVVDLCPVHHKEAHANM